MKFLYLSAIATLSAIAVTSLPQVTVYADGGYNGPSEYLENPAIKCVSLNGDSDDNWEDKITSLKLDKGWYCRFYVLRDCNDGEDGLNVNGDVSNVGDVYNDQFSSYQCFKGNP